MKKYYEFIEFIERPVNFNLISAIAIALILVIMAVIGHSQIMPEETKLSELKNDIDRTLSQEEIDDVGGYGLIAGSLGYGIKKIAYGVTFDILVGIPRVISAVTAVSAVVLRIVYSAKNPKCIKAYRIIAGFNYLFILFSIAVYTCMVLTDGYVIIIIPTVILDLLIARMLITSIRNTYSKRILEEY